MNKIHFEKLTPNKDIDLNTYEEALDFIFEDDEIKNSFAQILCAKPFFYRSYKLLNSNPCDFQYFIRSFNISVLVFDIA